MNRAAIIVTDADSAIVTLVHSFAQGQAMSGGPVDLSEQLLADLHTLAALPNLLTLDDDPPSILETPVTVSNAILLAALEAATRVRALLPEGGGDRAEEA